MSNTCDKGIVKQRMPRIGKVCQKVCWCFCYFLYLIVVPAHFYFLLELLQVASSSPPLLLAIFLRPILPTSMHRTLFQFNMLTLLEFSYKIRIIIVAFRPHLLLSTEIGTNLNQPSVLHSHRLISSTHFQSMCLMFYHLRFISHLQRFVVYHLVAHLYVYDLHFHYVEQHFWPKQDFCYRCLGSFSNNIHLLNHRYLTSFLLHFLQFLTSTATSLPLHKYLVARLL